MNRQISKLPTLWLAIALALLFLMPLAAQGEAAEFTFEAETGRITAYSGASKEIIVPAELEGAAVKSLKYGVFTSNESAAVILLPDTLEAIGSNNFFSCPSLTEVTIPARVAFIDGGCFSWCDNLKSVTFQGEAPVFGPGCFSEVPEGFVCYVPEDQYEVYRALLPDDITIETTGNPAQTIGWTAAEADFDFDPASGTITAYKNNATRVDVPESIGGTAVKAIGDGAFANHNGIYLVNLPEGVEIIGKEAFKYANDLVSVTLPDSLRVIGEEAFNGGWHSRSITWPAALEEIGPRAFRYTPLADPLHFEGRTLKIGENAFEYTSIQSLYLTDTPVTIASHAFEGSKLNYLCIDAYGLLEGIAGDAFAGAADLADLDLPWDSPLENQLAWRAFMAEQAPNCYVWINNPTDCAYPANEDCSYGTYADGTLYLATYTGNQEALTNYHTFDGVPITGIGDGVFKGNQTLKKFRATHSDQFTTIGAEAFADSAVEVVDLYYTVETIGEGAFRNCVNLTELTLPASVIYIGAGAFEGCTNLQALNVLCDKDLLQAEMFIGCSPELIAQLGVSAPPASNEEDDAEPDAEAGTIEAVPVGEAGEPYLGAWVLDHVVMGEEIYKAADLGMEKMAVVFRADGTAEFGDDGEYRTVAWSVTDKGIRLEAEDETLEMFLAEDGNLVMDEEGIQMIFIRGEAQAEVASSPRNSEPAEQSSEAADETQVLAGDTRFLETKYTCTSFVSGGVTMDAAVLGAEYSIVLHEDGTLDFIMAGAEVPGLVWRADGDDFVTDYFGQGELRFVPNGDALELDFFGGMQMTFRAG